MSEAEFSFLPLRVLRVGVGGKRTFERKRLSIGVIAGWSAMRYRSAGGFRRSAASTGAV